MVDRPVVMFTEPIAVDVATLSADMENVLEVPSLAMTDTFMLAPGYVLGSTSVARP